MACATVGDLRAFLDGELAGEVGARVEGHLESCPACRGSLEELRSNAAVARLALDRTASDGARAPQPSWGRVRERAERAGGRPVTFSRGVSEMLGNLGRLMGGSRVRVATSVVSVLVAVGLLFTLPPVQTAAGSFLSIFRVNKFVAVTIDPSSMPKLAPPGELGSFTTSGELKPKSASLAEAEKALGRKVLAPSALPAGIESKPRTTELTESFTASFVPDLKKVRAYLSTLGASDVKLPDNLDGAQITMQVHPAVAMLYAEPGGLERTSEGNTRPHAGQRFLFVGQTSSPTMSVPDGLDVERVRSELLKVPGLPADLVNQIKAIDDWRNTVVVPVVRGTSREVTVQGEKGVLVSESGGTGLTLLWQKGGTVFTLTGNVSEAEILAAANSLK